MNLPCSQQRSYCEQLFSTLKLFAFSSEVKHLKINQGRREEYDIVSFMIVKSSCSYVVQRKIGQSLRAVAVTWLIDRHVSLAP